MLDPHRAAKPQTLRRTIHRITRASGACGPRDGGGRSWPRHAWSCCARGSRVDACGESSTVGIGVSYLDKNYSAHDAKGLLLWQNRVSGARRITMNPLVSRRPDGAASQNIRSPASDIERPTPRSFGCWLSDVGCWMFSLRLPRKPADCQLPHLSRRRNPQRRAGRGGLRAGIMHHPWKPPVP